MRKPSPLTLTCAFLGVQTLLLGASACASSGGQHGAPARPGEFVRTPDLADEIIRFREDFESFNQYHSLRWSEGVFDKREAFLSGRLEELMKQPPALWGTDGSAATLSAAARVDAILLRNQVRAEIAETRLRRRQLAEMKDLVTVRDVVVPLEEARWRMEKVDPKGAAQALSKVPGLVKAARERAKAAPPSAVVAQRAALALWSYAEALRGWYDQSAGYVPEFSWWCAKPHEEAQRDIDEFARYLREEVAGIRNKPEDPLVGDPIGREALLDALKNEFVAYSPEELIAIADAEMAWCTEQAKAAAREMGLGDDWHAALERVKGEAEPPGGQAPYVVGVAREAIAFVKERDLVTVPPMCEELWKAQMLTPRAQKSLPFAVYFSQAIGIAAPTDSMSTEDKLMAMRGNNRRFTRIVVPHELIPGHHLQGFMAARERPYRQVFSTPFLVEGWALYWEMKLWDLGWAKGPEDRLGMLFWRMHRCARITVSLKFHLGEMAPEQMIDFLIEKVGHEKANATAEVRRYVGGDYSPLYQCGYMVGGKELRALHVELVKSGKMTEKAFNDAVLRCGPIPIELIRAELTDAPMTIESEAGWRFGN